MNQVNQEMINASVLLHEKRERMQREKVATTTLQSPRHIGNLVASGTDHLTDCVPTKGTLSGRVVSIPEIRHWFNLSSFDTLTTNHMSRVQREQFESVIQAVRKWRNDCRIAPGRAFILASKNVGVGKTHIARAVMASFHSLVIDDLANDPMVYSNGSKNFTLERHGVMYKGSNLMELLVSRNDVPPNFWAIVKPSHRLLVIDELGREGNLPYVGAGQRAEVEHRYGRLIDHIYDRNQQGTRPVNVFITGNKTLDGMSELLGEATWDRLEQMAPVGNMVNMSGIPSYRRKVASGRE